MVHNLIIKCLHDLKTVVAYKWLNETAEGVMDIKPQYPNMETHLFASLPLRVDFSCKLFSTQTLQLVK